MPAVLSMVIAIQGFTDPFSALTHLLGAGGFGVWAVLLVLRGRGGPGPFGGGAPPLRGGGAAQPDGPGPKGRMVALGLYGFAAVAQLGVSGAYHILERDHLPRLVMQRIDHAIIFFLIMATFVPLHAIMFRGWRNWGALTVMAVLAATGISLKSVFFSAIPDWVGLTLYVAMGWLGGYGGLLLYRRYGWPFVRPLVWGGIAYTLGGLVEFLNWPVVVAGVVEPHELFHLAVLAGLAFHFRFTWAFAKGAPPRSGRPGH